MNGRGDEARGQQAQREKKAGGRRRRAGTRSLLPSPQQPQHLELGQRRDLVGALLRRCRVLQHHGQAGLDAAAPSERRAVGLHAAAAAAVAGRERRWSRGRRVGARGEQAWGAGAAPITHVVGLQDGPLHGAVGLGRLCNRAICGVKEKRCGKKHRKKQREETRRATNCPMNVRHHRSLAPCGSPAFSLTPQRC